MASNIIALFHGDSGRVHITSGDSGLTVTAGKSSEEIMERINGLTVSTGKTSEELPEDIMEKIILRIPFPSLFKTKLLSKTWYFKFSHASQLIDTPPTLKSLPTLASSTSFKWPTYCPVHVSHEAILGFDRTSARWQTMMDISYLPISTWSFVTCAGPLFCVTKWDMRKYRSLEACVEESLDVFVTNPITRDWRKLEFPQRGDEPLELRLVNEPVVLNITMQGSHAYQVLMVSHYGTDKGGAKFVSHVYDSSRKAYKRNTFEELAGAYIDLIYPTTAYLNGNLYGMFDSYMFDVVSLWMYNVKNNVFSVIDRFTNCIQDVSKCGALLCGDKVMVVLFRYGADYLKSTGSIDIFELDGDTRQLELVSTAPPEFMYYGGAENSYRSAYKSWEMEKIRFSSDSDCIFFGRTWSTIPMFSYNIRSDEWNCHPGLYVPQPAGYDWTSQDINWPWTTGPFQPGLCPFVMV